MDSIIPCIIQSLKKLNAVQKYFDYNDDGKISNFEIGLGVVDLGITIFDIVSIPSGEAVAGHIALKQTAKSFTTKTVVKTGAKFFKFGGDEAVKHFGKHADQIMKVTGKSAYNLKNYVDDANWIIKKELTVPSLTVITITWVMQRREENLCLVLLG